MVRFLFKQPGYKRFAYRPRFYDADHEDLQRRIDAAKRELGQDDGNFNPELMRGNLNHAWRSNYSKGQNRRSNRNVLVIAGILCVIAYFVLFI